MLIDKKFKYKVLLKDTIREWLVVEIVSPSNFIVMVSYRCEKRYSKKAYSEWLFEELSRLNKTNKHVILMGDFNIDLLAQNSPCQALMDTLKSFNLHLSSPLAVTREQGDSKSCLDHIYSDLKVSSYRVYECTITDHYFVWVMFEKSLKCENLTPMYRNFNNLSKNDNFCKYNFAKYKNKKNWVDNKLERELNKRDHLHKVWAKDPENMQKRWLSQTEEFR